MPTYELVCLWCPTTLTARIHEEYPKEIREGDELDLIKARGRFDEKLIKELIDIFRLHEKQRYEETNAQGEKTHPGHISDEELRKKAILEVRHLHARQEPPTLRKG